MDKHEARDCYELLVLITGPEEFNFQTVAHSKDGQVVIDTLQITKNLMERHLSTEARD